MEFNAHMLAYCGLYCEQCSFKAANEERDMRHLEAAPERLVKVMIKAERIDLADCKCECCKGDSLCGSCGIRNCASERRFDSCADCGDFPCERVERFEHDGLWHHAEAVRNLRDIREHGTERWFEGIRPALNCHCGERQSWYYRCPEHQESSDT